MVLKVVFLEVVIFAEHFVWKFISFGVFAGIICEYSLVPYGWLLVVVGIEMCF